MADNFCSYGKKGLFKLLNRGPTKVLKEIGVPNEMKINSREPRYNCFFKSFFLISLSLSASLSFSFKCLFSKRIVLAGMTPKHTCILRVLGPNSGADPAPRQARRRLPIISPQNASIYMCVR